MLFPFREAALLAVLLINSPANASAASIQFFEGGAVALSADGKTALVNGLPTEYGTRIADIRQRARAAWEDGDEAEIERLGMLAAEVQKLRFQGSYRSGLIDVDTGRMEQLSHFPRNGSALGLSSDGRTILGWTETRQRGPLFSFRDSEGLQYCEDPTSSIHYWDGISISGDGQTVVGRDVRLQLLPDEGRISSQSTAFLWEEGKLSDRLDIPPSASSSAANGVSTDGRVVVGSLFESASRNEAVRWVGERPPESLVPEHLDIDWSSATDVSGDGRTVIGRYREEEGFRVGAFVVLQDNTFLDLGKLVPGGISANLLALSDTGETAVGQVELSLLGNGSADAYAAVVWNATGGAQLLSELLTRLGVDLGGQTLYAAIDVSADGRRILGHTGGGGSFVAIIPEPSTALLLALGLTGIARITRP